MKRAHCLALLFLFLSTTAHADRSAAQGPSGLYLEKKGRYAEAALYYQRALHGYREVWIGFWYHGEIRKAHPMTQKALGEYGDRLKRCLALAKMTQAEREHMDAVNAFWMSEYVIEELGGYKLAFARRAEECEKHGDFLLATQLRSAAAEYCTLVAAPYYERIATERKSSLHRKAADAWKQRAREHERMARGDRLLARIKGLQAPTSRPDLGQHYFNSYRVFHKRVLSPKGGRWLTGRTPGQVAAVLRDKGLKHPDEDARAAAAVVLSNIGGRQARGTETIPNALPGLTRTAPDGAEVRDATIDMGAWWTSGDRSIHNRPNPLLGYTLPAKVTWRGHLVVKRPGSYRFTVRSRGEKQKGFSRQEGLYFTPPCVKLHLDGKQVLPDPTGIIEDAKMHVRFDRTEPIALETGLHAIRLDMDLKNVGTGLWQAPSVRLYWESDGFLREVIPAGALVTMKQEP